MKRAELEPNRAGVLTVLNEERGGSHVKHNVRLYTLRRVVFREGDRE
jgi:hypothetical protein